jgi:dTDP-4-dehydrorhamnose reductase
MKILLTGAAGQLGQALQTGLTKHEVLAYDHQQLDITDLFAVREAVQATRPHIVVNTAAFTAVDQAESEADTAFRANALGPRNLAVTTAAVQIPLLHVSTDYVFDGTATRPYHEFDRPHPQSLYGLSKLAGEEAVQALNPRHYIVRTAWLYHTVGKNFLYTMLRLAQQDNRQEVCVVSDQYGSPTYAPHLAERIAELMTTEAYGLYHLAGQGGTSWYELTHTLYRCLGIQTPVRPVATADFPRPAHRPRYAVLTTLHTPPLLLPVWEDGVAEFSRRVTALPGGPS